MERTRNDASADAHIWALSDGRAGNARQASALAAALAAALPGDVAIETLVLAPRAPWRWAAPRRLPGATQAFGAHFRIELACPPGIAVGCGRQAALATRLLRAQGARVVQILDPRLPPSHWDAVVVPGHDALRGDNVIITRGGLHPVDDAWLALARGAFPGFADLPGPRTSVLLGGNSRHARFGVVEFEHMAGQLDAVLAREGGSLLMTTSRRSSETLRAAVRARYADRADVLWCDPEDGPNPYPGLLAWADRIVCSPDSVNMVSEACATRAPVFVAAPASVSGRPRHFLDTLLASKRIRPLDERMAAFDAIPLRETTRIAGAVLARLSR